MQADVITLYQSDFCKVTNFLCRCTDCALSEFEYQKIFSICYVRKGNFQFKVFRNDLDAYSGLYLINKPGFEHRVAHEHHLPDECTVFSYSEDFYKQIADRYKHSFNGFFRNRDLNSILIKPSMASEYLHYRIFQLVQQKEASSLQIETLVLELVNKLFNRNQEWADYQSLSSSQKQNYLSGIEQAKRYLQTHFTQNISLADIASACFMSKFHFSRIFRHIAGITPHQYLMHFRLNHAAHLLKNSSMPVTQIAFESGFNDSNHFSATFKSHYDISPSIFARKSKISKVIPI